MRHSDRPRPAPGRPVRAPAAPGRASAAVALGFLVLYLAACPPVSGDGDSSEFTVVLATLGLAHPTGYVPYTLLGHAWVSLLRLAGAGAPWAANAWSAVGGALALGLAHALASRLLVRAGLDARRARRLALLPALALGMDPAWTELALLAEVNTWHVAWVMGALLFAVDTLESLPARRDAPGWLPARAAAWSALAALGLSHHATSVLAVVPITVALARAAGRPRPSWLAASLAGLPLLLGAWGVVLYRSWHPAAVQWPTLAPGLAATWLHVSGAGYRHFLGGFAPAPSQRAEWATYLLPWLAAGGAATLAWPFVRSPVPRAVRGALAASFALLASFPFLYAVPDPVPYFTAPVALGLVVLPAVLAGVASGRRAGPVLVAVAGVLVAAQAVTGAGATLRRRAVLEEADAFLRRAWTDFPIARGWVIWDSDLSLRLVEYQRLDGLRPGLVVVRPRLLMDDRARALFERRYGVDPLAGAPSPPRSAVDDPELAARFADAVAAGLNELSPESVAVFRPERGEVRVPDKPVAHAVAPR